MGVLLDVWREVGRHIELEELVERIVPPLCAAMSLQGLLVLRLETERQRLLPLAVRVVEGVSMPSGGGVPLSANQVEALVAWARTRRAVYGADAPTVASLLAPTGWEGDVLMAALQDGPAVLGFAVALGPPRSFDSRVRELWSDLREPLAAALRSELQRQEIARYRNALEADRQALLTRLDRQEITDAVVGADGGLSEVMDRVAQVAETDVPVLLLGETGTGKEVIAREIHRRSTRSRGPVVRVNCGAIPPGLIDSELFGHERGSFTGALRDRAGWFERADGGTLFLDEIGELPPEAQVRLLRVLQDGTFERVGAHRTHRVDVRIVAATHRDLQAMVYSGGFREDLWYRISVFPIRLPPLRERPGDIPALAEHFAWRAGKRLGGVPLAPSPADLDLLVHYPWPGNVRELAAVIERAVILGRGRRLEIAAALGSDAGTAARASGRSPTPHSQDAPFLTLDQAMRLHIEAALRRTRGRIEGRSGAAALLGINPHTLRSRMRKLGIDWATFRQGDIRQPLTTPK